MQKQTILIVDDEPSIAETLEYALQSEGFYVTTCQLGGDAIELLSKSESDKKTHYSLVVLDVGLPDMNGFEVCKAIRDFSEVPVLFLTARDQELDRIIGLEIGADDYVTKPFSPREVATRIKVILKRVHAAAIKQFDAVEPVKAELEDKESTQLKIDTQKARVLFFGHELKLTKYEYLLISTLGSQPERVFSRSQLMEIIWPDTIASLERSVDTHIKSLRAKLRIVNADQEVIKTHRGLGYSLNRL